MKDCVLVEVLLELHNIGRYKVDRGFKSRLLQVVEKALDAKLSGYGLKIKSHIESRMKTLKSHFNIIYDMVYGPNTGEFGWDPVKKCVMLTNLFGMST